MGAVDALSQVLRWLLGIDAVLEETLFQVRPFAPLGPVLAHFYEQITMRDQVSKQIELVFKCTKSVRPKDRGLLSSVSIYREKQSA